MAKRIGFGNYQYEVVEHWPKVAIHGAIADVCVDARGRVYAGVRNPREEARSATSWAASGTCWCSTEMERGRQLGQPGLLAARHLGQPGWRDLPGRHGLPHHHQTRADRRGAADARHQGPEGPRGQPFNMPTHAVEAPNGDIFVSDGYGQNRIHRFSAKGEHILTFGGGDAVFIPAVRSRARDRQARHRPVPVQRAARPAGHRGHRVYVMDRENNRWQVFTTDGEFSACRSTSATRTGSPSTPTAPSTWPAAPASRSASATAPRSGAGARGRGAGAVRRRQRPRRLDGHRGSLYTAEASRNNRLQKFVRV